MTGLANGLGDLVDGPDVAKRNLIRQAAIITDLGMETAREWLSKAYTENVTEADVARAVEETMTSQGSNPYVEAFPPLIISGNDSALPHGDPNDDETNEILEGEVVVVDIGARFKGWVADETRTYYIGDDPPEEFLRVYGIVKEAHDRSAVAMTVGRLAGDIDKIARDYISAEGYGENFTHCLGHGLGIYVHQPPMLCPDSTDPIMAWSDQVVTIEPGIYLEGQWGIRIEDDYAVTRTGPEQYTHTPDDLDWALIPPPMNQSEKEPPVSGESFSFDLLDKAKIAFVGIIGLGIAVAVVRRIRRRGRRIG